MLTAAYRHQTTVRLAHTDAAGLLFFPNQFLLAHEAYEEWLRSAGFSIAQVLREGAVLIPIVHCEADFLIPLQVGDSLVVEMRCEARGTNSFTLGYTLHRGKEIVGSVKTVHVCMARASMGKIPPPSALADALDAISVSN